MAAGHRLTFEDHRGAVRVTDDGVKRNGIEECDQSEERRQGDQRQRRELRGSSSSSPRWDPKGGRLDPVVDQRHLAGSIGRLSGAQERRVHAATVASGAEGRSSGRASTQHAEGLDGGRFLLVSAY